MRPRANVYAEVDAPKFFAVYFVTINNDIAGFALLRIVFRIARIPLENQLKFSIAVYIAYRDIVRAVGVIAPTIRTVKIYGQILITPNRNCSIRCHFLAADNSLHRVFARCCSFCICVVACL